MTVLELIFNIEYSETENYDKYYYLWCITDNGLYMYFTFKEDIPEIEGIRVEEIQNALRNISNLYDNDELFLDEKQTFVPYEYLKPYIDITIDFECSVPFNYNQRNPLIMVRGTCDKNCPANKDDKNCNLYCFQGFPCFNNRPDWNVWSSKNPNFYDFIFSVIEFIMKCKGIDAVIALLEYTPISDAPTLDFDYSTVLKIDKNHIQVVQFGKQLYNEYNKKFPTEDRQIEGSISVPDENFYFKF